MPKFFRHYVQFHPIHFDKSIIPKQNRSHRSNVICDGSSFWIIMEIFIYFPNLLRQQ